MADAPDYGSAIASIESGGNYGLLGPQTSGGDQAYGKYQIMGDNIGPWTKEVLGAPMAPTDFLKNPAAQDAVFNAKFGQYVDKYGPEGAAQAWFAGPGGVGKTDRTDQLGTSVGAYGKKFMAALDGQPSAPPLNAPQQSAQQAPQQSQQSFLPQQVSQFLSPQAQQGVQQSMGMPPSLSAPQAPQIPQAQPIQFPGNRFNLAQAFQKIPLPAGFRGFTFNQG